MNSHRLWIICLALSAMGSQGLLGDVIYFKKGHYVEAQAIDDGDSWRLVPISTARIRLPRAKSVPKDDVLKVVSEAAFQEQLNARLQKLEPGDLDGKQQVLTWCHEEHFTAFAKKVAQEMLTAQKKMVKEDSTPDALCEVACWANGSPQRLYLPRKEASRLFAAVLRMEPEHEAAHLGLKHKRHEDRWVTAQEYKKLTRAPRKPPRRRERNKKPTRKRTPIWYAALTGRLPFGTKPEEVVKFWGQPSRRDQSTSRQQGNAEGTRSLTLGYTEGKLETRVEFRNDALRAFYVRCPMLYSVSEGASILDGEPIAPKHRKKALNQMLSEKRLSIGMTRDEVEVIKGKPEYSHTSSSRHSSSPYEYWTYRSGGGTDAHITFRGGLVSSIRIYERSY